MICGSCGTENPDGAAFCRLCFRRFGGSVPSNESAPPVELEPTGIPARSGGGRGTKKALLVSLIIVVVMAGAMLAVVILLTRPLPGDTKEFVNKAAGYSFSYPSSWKTVTEENRQQLGFGGDRNPLRFYNQVFLIERRQGLLYSLGVSFFGAGSDMTPEKWEKQKEDSVERIRQVVARLESQGARSRGVECQDTKVGGADAYSIVWGYEQDGVLTSCQLVHVDAGKHRLGFDYTSMRRASDGDCATFQKILDSVEFKK